MDYREVETRVVKIGGEVESSDLIKALVYAAEGTECCAEFSNDDRMTYSFLDGEIVMRNVPNYVTGYTHFSRGKPLHVEFSGDELRISGNFDGTHLDEMKRYVALIYEKLSELGE